MNPISPFGAFTPAAANTINQNFASLTPLFRTVYYVDPAGGYDGNLGLSPGLAYKTLAAAYGACVDGRDDAVALIGNGSTSATARINAPFVWSKNATHLVGLSSGVNLSNRSRLAPDTGVAAFANFFTVSGNGCQFQNLQWFDGFSTGGLNQICLTLSGGRNYFSGCHIAGMGDAASAADTGARSLLITGTTGENQFDGCTFGIDTIARSVVNATVEFAGGTPRNIFRNSRFIAWLTGSGSGAFHGLATGAAAIDRFQAFENCQFYQSAFSGAGVAMSALLHVTTSAAGGEFILQFPSCAGVTAYGDATTKALTYVIGPAPDKTSGLGVVAT